jgi:hypothetical protein
MQRPSKTRFTLQYIAKPPLQSDAAAATFVHTQWRLSTVPKLYRKIQKACATPDQLEYDRHASQHTMANPPNLYMTTLAMHMKYPFLDLDFNRYVHIDLCMEGLGKLFGDDWALVACREIDVELA